MFYSQFILAKKGPLGTIWIAAHLERKLRKNQVADTDIGVSVDSILFPDVPIALRLSSHLLLGVVRIYSRKVNYLFDDCSEALLKVKQAFRSTAVDLPPEESTAPYHSITLPETFDLDDFELPENDIFQGNYVDHHISTREQITLQDTMEGVVYSTSQFGLDERFGDGDTSQVGLDLEEELLLDKAAVTGHNEVSENDAQMSVGAIPHPETHANRERGSSEDMPLNVATDKIPDLAEDFEVVDYADAPCTPGLVEPNVHSVKEGLACDDHLESEDNTSRELMGKTDDMTGEPSCNHLKSAMELSSGKNVNHNTLVSVHVEDNHLSGKPEKNQAVGGEFLSEAVTTKDIPADESVSTPVELAKSEDKGEAVSCNNACANDNVEICCDIEVPHSNGNATATSQSMELTSAQECVNVESEDCQGLVNCEISNDHNINNEQTVSTSTGFLRPCNSNIGQLDRSSPVEESFVVPELKSVDVEPSSLNTDKTEEGHVLESSTKRQGEECHASDGIQSEDLRTSGQTFTRKTLEDGGKHAKESDGLISEDTRCEDVNTSMTSELPAPEKLLSAPTSLLDEPHDMLIETPLKEVQEEGCGSEDGAKITGKKRSFAESALTVQSLNSVNSFGVAGTRGTAESIPDDDDLLSSILVGRKSSFLKIKPSPPASEVPSKRARPSASRPSALKRKVLMDDSMVLHGDTIRQQLTSTEDIRRLRKKAPCTNTEISMIQRQFLEEEIFNVPVLTGISVELTHLHNEAFDLSSIRVCENVDNIQVSLESGDVENIAKKNVNEVGEIEGGANAVTSINDADEQPPQFSVQNGIQQDKDGLGSHDINSQENRNCTAEDNLGESSGNEGCRENFHVAAATNSTATGVETLQSELLSGEISQLPADHADQSALTVDPMQMDTPNLSAAAADIQPSEEVPFMNDTSNVLGHEDIDAADQSADRRVLGTAAFEETIDVGVDGLAPNEDVDASLADVSALNDGCCNLDSMNVDQNLENAENDKNRGCSDDVGLVSSEGINDKDQNPNSLCNDESEMDPTRSVGVESDVKDSSINHDDHVADPLHQVDPEDKYDFHSGPSANDTEFLNVDDDEIDENEDDGMPNTEDTRLLENTGWSSRTRAVARYLQTLFDKEAENRRKGLSVDSLLAGKTRKEASRMFFETLVLKTRDYIQVEQPQAFASINIKPRSRLMKSDF